MNADLTISKDTIRTKEKYDHLRQTNLRKTDSYKGGSLPSLGEYKKTNSFEGDLSSLERNRKIRINLEDLSIQEEKLWEILESIRKQGDLFIAVDEFLDFANISSIQSLDSYVQLKEVSKEVRCHCSYQLLAAVIVFVAMYNTQPSSEQNEQFKALFFNLHQAFLIITKMVTERISPEVMEKNYWVGKMIGIIDLKLESQLKDQDVFLLTENNKIVANSLNCLIKLLFKKR